MNHVQGYAAAQARYDAMTPPEDDGREDFIEQQVGLLLDVEDSREVRCDEFIESAIDRLSGRQDELVQLVLAIYRGRAELAENIGNRLGKELDVLAEGMIEKELDA